MKYIILFALIIGHLVLKAQCNPSYKGVLCIDNPIEFLGNVTGGVQFYWNFNNEGSNNTNLNPIFKFSQAGLKTISFLCIKSNGDTCAGSVQLTIKNRPKINIRLLTDSVQCFEGNVFCFRDSSLSGENSSCIVSIKYLFSDGELISRTGTRFNPVQLPQTICKSINDPQGQSVTLLVEVEDCNGCITRYDYPHALKVDFLPVLFASYNVNAVSCGKEITALFKNASQVNLSDVQSFEWDFGDGNKSNSNWDTISHFYKIGDSLSQSFFPKFKVTTKQGCVNTFKMKKITMFNLKPRIYISKDSSCLGDSFSFKLLPDYMKIFVKSTDVSWRFGTTLIRDYGGSFIFGRLGPHQISMSISHVCGPFIFEDTFKVIGPLSVIEREYLIPQEERFQCVIKDSVHFFDQSKFYHNDSFILDDDSLFRKQAGNLGHSFTNRQPTNYSTFIRKNDFVDRLWDFGDEYCDACTTDIKANRNTWLNCRYTRTKDPVHWYTPWDSVYQYLYGFKSFEIPAFNKQNFQCEKRKIFASDSVAITSDTILYFGDNPLGIRAKDSAIFKGLRQYKIPGGLYGKGSLDAPILMQLYVKSKDSIIINRKNGNVLLLIIGPQFYMLGKNEEVRVTSKTDTCWFIFGLKINVDTMAPQFLRPHQKVKKWIKNPFFNVGDSINPDFHRQLFYNKVPVCFLFRLTQKDWKHPLKCENETAAKLSLMPPSAKRLRISDQYCFGYGNKIVEFDFGETKPGCSQSFAKINFNYKKYPDSFFLINDLDKGDVYRNTFTNKSKPYTGYLNEGPFRGTIFKKYSDNVLDSIALQAIDIALIIGNGNSVEFCSDTIFYPNFVFFPRINTLFDILGKKKNDINVVCAREPVCVYVPKEDSKSNKFIDANNWFFIDFHSRDTLQSVRENYYKLQKNRRFPNQLVNYVVVSRFDKTKKGSAQFKSDTIFTAIVHKHRLKLLNTVNNNLFIEKLQNLGFIYSELNNESILDFIWNNTGTIGLPSSGSKGCVDTLGFGRLLRFEIIQDSVTYLSFKDSSFAPLDISTPHNTYCFNSPYNGNFLVLREMESGLPNYCPKYEEKYVIVGHKASVEFQDSIFCKGEPIEAKTEFRYYSTADSSFGLIDSIDYWTDRADSAGLKGFEGMTIWDYDKNDDDRNNPVTIFGQFPYATKGIGNPSKILGNEPNGIYYRSPGFYSLRVKSADSLGCIDTFKQNLYILGPQAGFYIDYVAPNCKTIVELFDTSKIIDPCVIKGLSPCDFIIYWRINWGDGSPEDEFTKNRPLQFGHDYKTNGTFRIWFYINTIMGCTDSVFMDISVPGPKPRFVTESTTTICVNDSVKFRNTSINPTTSAQWLWNFGDDLFQPQKDTGIIWHQYKKTGEFFVYLAQDDSIKNTGKFCTETYPDTFNKIKVIVKPNDVINLSAMPKIICVGDSVKINATIQSFNNYQKYDWRFENDSFQTKNNKTISYQLTKTGAFKVYFKPNLFGLQILACPNMDSIEVFADTIIANFDIDTSNAPDYCFNNTSTNGVSYRWGFFHDDDIVSNKKVFLENESQNAPENRICENFRKNPGENWICLEAKNALGCKDTICKKIINRFEQLVLPPNVFTPGAKDGFVSKDKDGNEGNNVFNIYIKGEDYYDLTIYDRWGVKVFESKDKNIDWNGQVFNNGTDCPSGSYFYVLTYRFKSSETKESILNGTVTLIRE